MSIFIDYEKTIRSIHRQHFGIRSNMISTRQYTRSMARKIARIRQMDGLSEVEKMYDEKRIEQKRLLQVIDNLKRL